MLEVQEIKAGEYKVTMTAMHHEWLLNCARKTNVTTEAVLALWLGVGQSSMAELCKD